MKDGDILEKFKSACLSRKKGKAEIIALLLYIAGTIIISYFHEPFFDEAQAWNIARSASIKEIFTFVPHYEGHPPLWHLILAPFAKSGAPFHLSVSLVNITFCTAAMALLLFKSPFPKAIRCTLPFTYFCFYQYGVISRPYSMMMLAFMLMAITYKNRNEKPWRYIFSMTFLCLTTSLGLLLAGGLCLVWTYEIITQLIKEKNMNRFYANKRFIPLCFILACAILIVITIMPADNCYYEGVDQNPTFWDIIKYKPNTLAFLYNPYECWSGTLVNMNYNATNDMFRCYLEAFFGLICWIALIAITKKNKKLLTFLIPYLAFDIFQSYHYSSIHHLGIVSTFHIFIFWIITEENGKIELPDFFGKIGSRLKSPLIRKIAGTGLCGLYLINVVFSGVSSFNDIRYSYSIQPVADFIKENDLEDRKIMVAWDFDYAKADPDNINGNSIFYDFAIPSNHPKVTSNHTLVIGTASTLMPYFDHNIFMNFNNYKYKDDFYMHYEYKEDKEAVFDSWEKQGLPDIIIGYCPIDEVYDYATFKDVRYAIINECKIHVNFKLHTTDNRTFVYMREDLLDEYPQLSAIYNPKIAGEYVPETEKEK